MLYVRIKDELICLDHVVHIYATTVTFPNGSRKPGIKIQFDVHSGNDTPYDTLIGFESEFERSQVLDCLQSALCASNLT